MTSRRVLCGILVIGVSAEAGLYAQAQSAAAQAPVPAPSPITLPVPDATRRQVEGFERILRGAIDSAAAQLNKRLGEAIPTVQIQLQFQAQPLVTSTMMPDDNAVFHVLIPMIEQTGIRIIEAWNATRSSRPTALVNATVVDPDPPGAPVKGTPFNPDVEYTKFARQALIDALVDHGMSVALPPGKTLTIIADELLPQSSPFTQRSRSLILQMKSEDLVALRENRIARDDAITRIREFRY